MRRPLSGIQIGVRVALFVVFALLIYGTLAVFLILDSTSHSASDTLRPLFLSIGPVWLVAVWAARVVLRSR
jgi:hypothetical protein